MDLGRRAEGSECVRQSAFHNPPLPYTIPFGIAHNRKWDIHVLGDAHSKRRIGIHMTGLVDVAEWYSDDRDRGDEAPPAPADAVFLGSAWTALCMQRYSHSATTEPLPSLHSDGR